MSEKETSEMESTLIAESIYGTKTRRGLVKLSYGKNFEIIIAPGAALAFALSVIQAANAAETDEILMKWLHKVVGVKDDFNAAQLLAEFRLFRDQMWDHEEKEKIE